MSSNFTRHSKDAGAAAKDPGIRAIPRLKFLRYVRNAKWVVEELIAHARVRRESEGASADGVFIRGENIIQRREKPPRKRDRERFFISIDRRSCGVGEIVYLARRGYSVGHRAIFLNLDAGLPPS